MKIFEFLMYISALFTLVHTSATADRYYARYTGNITVTSPSSLQNCDDENSIPLRYCFPDEILDCTRYEELKTHTKNPPEQEASSSELRLSQKDKFLVREHRKYGNYVLEILGVNQRFTFSAFHSQESGVSTWNVTLQLQSRTGGMMDFAIEDFPELKILFSFKQFLLAVENHNSGYHWNENRLVFEWSKAKKGDHRLRETSVDCRCAVPGKSDEVPCDERLEGSVSSTSGLLAVNIAATPWIVAWTSVAAVLRRLGFML